MSQEFHDAIVLVFTFGNSVFHALKHRQAWIGCVECYSQALLVIDCLEVLLQDLMELRDRFLMPQFRLKVGQ
jgi:hypothetical protein